jgi:hypothetical protein
VVWARAFAAERNPYTAAATARTALRRRRRTLDVRLRSPSLNEALRDAGRLLILAPILAVVGFTLVQISHLIPIAMAYELVPDYVHATGATKDSIASTADMFAVLALVLNYAGDVVLWGVVVPMYAYAALKNARRWALDRLARLRRGVLRRLARSLCTGLGRDRRHHFHRLRRLLRLDGSDGCVAPSRPASRCVKASPSRVAISSLG